MRAPWFEYQLFPTHVHESPYTPTRHRFSIPSLQQSPPPPFLNVGMSREVKVTVGLMSMSPLLLFPEILRSLTVAHVVMIALKTTHVTKGGRGHLWVPCIGSWYF